MRSIKSFLDDKNRVKSWPSKKAKKIEVLKYIASKFEVDRVYAEKEVNSIIDQWHTFQDYFMLRRGMIDYKLLGRTRNGSEYWRMNRRPSEMLIMCEYEINDLMKKYDVCEIRVFGSIARGEDTEKSDVDLIVDMPGNSLMAYGGLKHDLENLLEKPLDMLTFSSLDEAVLAHFIRNSISISELKAGTRLVGDEKIDKIQMNLKGMIWVIDRILDMTHVTEKEFMENTVLKDAVTRNMQLLGQVASQIPNDFNGMALQHCIPLRDALFMNVDYAMLWKTVVDDLKPLKESFENYLKK